MKFNEKESRAISLVQAVGISSVVLGHFYFQPFDVLHPYVFHMPLFFFLGGLLLSIKKSLPKKILSIIQKHGGYLVKSYIITGLLSLILVYYFSVEERKPFDDGIISTIKLVIKSNFGNNGLFVVGWFLLAYIIANALCAILVSIDKGGVAGKVFIAFFAILSFYFGMYYLPALYVDRSHYIINISAQVSTASAFMLTGYLAKNYLFKLLRLDVMVILVLAMIAVKNLGYQKGVNIAWTGYPSGIIISIITSLSAIYILFTICSAAASLKGTNPLIIYIAKNTKSIMTYHIFSFYLVDLFFYTIGVYDIKKTATYSHYKNIETWPIYILCGITLPLAMVLIYDVTIKKINLNKKLKFFSPPPSDS